MKTRHFLIKTFLFLSLPLVSQQNNTLRGKMLFLSSGKTPAVGVEISGSVEGVEKANLVYTADDGSYILVFPKARDGHSVNLAIGEKDKNGKSIEIVNEKEIEICKIPAKVSDEFEIIVCAKGARDLAAQKYYKIIKTSADIALVQTKKEMDALLAQQQKDYQKIAELGEKIANLEKQADSLAIYKEALQIASVNKDNATKRVLLYIQLLDEGKSIQEAREALSIKDAVNDLEASILLFKAGIEELERRAGASIRIFDYKDAITCYINMISSSETMGIDRLKIAIYYANAAEAFFKDGQYEKTLEYLGKSLSLREEALNPDHPDIIESYHDIAVTYQSLGQYEKALEYQQKSIAIEEEIFDSKNPQLAISYNNLGLTYQGLGQYEKALEYLQKNLNIFEEILDPKDTRLANSYDNIGGIYQDLGQYEIALEYLQKAIGIREEFLHAKDPELATSYNNIASIYVSLGQFEKALEYHEKNIKNLEEVLYQKHPYLAFSYNNIGTPLKALGQYERALYFEQKAINILEEILKPKHPHLAIFYINIGRTHLSLKQFDQAIAYQRRGIGIFEEILESNHPNLASSYYEIAGTFKITSQYEKALEYFHKAINIQEIALKPEHPHLGNSYWSVALTYKELKEFHKAISYQEKCLKIFKASLTPDHPYYQEAFIDWLDIYYAKAFEALKKKDFTSSLADFDTILIHADTSYVNYGQTWNFTGLCHFHLGEFSKAIKAYQMAATLQPELKEQNFYNDIGLTYVMNRQFQEAETAFTEYERLFPNDGRSCRNWAVYYALQGDEEKAMSYLQKAIESGYDDVDWLKTDDSLNALRKKKGFIEIIEKLESRKN